MLLKSPFKATPPTFLYSNLIHPGIGRVNPVKFVQNVVYYL